MAVSRWDLLNEHRAAEEVVADNVVRRILSDAGLEAKRKHKLSITNDRLAWIVILSEAVILGFMIQLGLIQIACHPWRSRLAY